MMVKPPSTPDQPTKVHNLLRPSSLAICAIAGMGDFWARRPIESSAIKTGKPMRNTKAR